MMSFLILPGIVLLIIFIVLALRDGNNNMSNKHNAKYAFYYLLSLVALVFTALSVGMIAFSIIDKTVADVLNNFIGHDSQLKFAISALLIAAPIFYLISGLINQGRRSGELDKDSAIRRWLTYLILFVSSLVVLGVLISVINAFLDGELTARFILKAATVFVISAAVFYFYFYDIKREEADKKDPVVKIFFFASLAVVVAAFTASWFFVEAPQAARARLLDQALTNNIYSLESAVNTYYDRHKQLPDNLTELANDPNVYLDAAALIDPDTKAAIVYNRLSDEDFEFCAVFRLDSAAADNGSGARTVYYPDNNKNHKAGYQCLKGTLYAAPKLLD
ncbi:MAG: hypothetical protein UV95_C0001G0016 [Candidatus Falkowbacteria bacterium GW2011_GWF2_43_32]|nr:MAG: hypothetical protein UV95_C0001G0016 [Candidatus Falkowbacteria bacterium GW2011_GWF2_43_32]